VQPLFRDRSLGRSSPGVRFPFRAGPRLGCPRFLATRPLSRPRRRCSPGSPLLGFFLPRTTLRRVPLLAASRSCDRTAEGEGRQTLTGAVLGVLAPLDGSGCARGTRESLAEPAVHRGAPTLRGLVSCRSRPWSRPSELSLLEEPYPLSRASCFLAGSRSTAQRRGTVRGIRGPFPRRADPFATASTRLTGLERPGRRFPGVARRRSFACCHARSRRLVSDRPGSPDSAAGTPASKLCSPRESVPA